MTGIPNGLRWPLALGIYTRLAGLAFQGVRVARWSSSQPRERGVLTRILSTPAVLLPELSCVTRRTLRRRLEWERSIHFCKERPFLRLPSCDARKIRCLRRVRFWLACCQSTAFQSV